MKIDHPSELANPKVSDFYYRCWGLHSQTEMMSHAKGHNPSLIT